MTEPPPQLPRPQALFEGPDVRALLRGACWWDGERPLRADPADAGRLPADTWERAGVPAGVRLEFTAHGARAVELSWSAAGPLPADAHRPAPDVFTLLADGTPVAQSRAATGPAAPGAMADVRMELPYGDREFTLHLPEALRPVVHRVRAVGGSLAPAPVRPRWLVYGDSIVEGWSASRPHLAWPAVAGRALGLDPVNLGYAGAARGEAASAEQLATLPADLLTVAFGTNCWSRTPSSAPLLRETVRAFLALARRGRRPDTPVLVVSPVLRPDAEHTPNALGATLAELRGAVEEAALGLGDPHVVLLRGGPLLRPEHLVDGVHPGDAGHALLAAAVASAVRSLSSPAPGTWSPAR